MLPLHLLHAYKIVVFVLQLLEGLSEFLVIDIKALNHILLNVVLLLEILELLEPHNLLLALFHHLVQNLLQADRLIDEAV